MTRDEREIQREITHVRRDLGDTVEALAYKANLPARAKDRGAELSEQIRHVPPSRWAIAGGALAAVLALLMVLRSMRSR
jgi:Protein of unknown function (DUF3618)